LHLRQSLRSSPEAEDLVLRAVRHVDELLEEPAVRDGAGDGPDDEAVLADLDEGHAAARVLARMHDEGLTTHLPQQTDCSTTFSKKLDRFYKYM